MVDILLNSHSSNQSDHYHASKHNRMMFGFVVNNPDLRRRRLLYALQTKRERERPPN